MIFRMVVENPTWGAPLIHGELLMLGFDLCERTISRWMKRAPRDPEPAKRWLAFLRNHREAIAAMERTSFESPWQNAVAERWVESCRRDLLDHVIAVNERHLKRLLSEYVRYYHQDRTHLRLRKGTPDYGIRSTASGRFLSQDRLGGLHHRYDRAA